MLERTKYHAGLADLKDPGDVLEALLQAAESHMREFNKNPKVGAFWPVETVIFYTKHTLCKNLSIWWRDRKTSARNNAGDDGSPGALNEEILMFVQYMGSVFQDILAGCLSNLPMALNTYMTNAVRDCKIDTVENGIFLVAQGKQLWERLQWPPPCAPPVNKLGQLCQWF